MAEEGLKKTDNELIHIGKPIPFDLRVFLRQLESLAKASYENSSAIVEMVEKIVPTFHPTVKNKSVNKDISADENEMLEELDTLREIQFAALEAAASDAEESEAVHDNGDI